MISISITENIEIVKEISKVYENKHISPSTAFSLAMTDFENFEKGYLENEEVLEVINQKLSQKASEASDLQAFINRASSAIEQRHKEDDYREEQEAEFLKPYTNIEFKNGFKNDIPDSTAISALEEYYQSTFSMSEDRAARMARNVWESYKTGSTVEGVRITQAEFDYVSEKNFSGKNHFLNNVHVIGHHGTSVSFSPDELP